jgi:hypothetical protein
VTLWLPSLLSMASLEQISQLSTNADSFWASTSYPKSPPLMASPSPVTHGPATVPISPPSCGPFNPSRVPAHGNDGNDSLPVHFSKPHAEMYSQDQRPNHAPSSGRVARKCLLDFPEMEIPLLAVNGQDICHRAYQLQCSPTPMSQLPLEPTFLATPIATATSLPLDCVPVEELSASGTLLSLWGLQHFLHNEPPPLKAPTTFNAYIATLPLWDRRLLQKVDITDDNALQAYLLSNQFVYVVSDGGAANERGSFGAVLAYTIFVKLSGSTEGATC